MNNKLTLVTLIALSAYTQIHAFKYTLRNESSSPIEYVFVIRNNRGDCTFPLGELQPGENVTEPVKPLKNVVFETIDLVLVENKTNHEWSLPDPYAQRYLDPAQNPRIYTLTVFEGKRMAKQTADPNNEPHFIYTFKNDGGDFKQGL